MLLPLASLLVQPLELEQFLPLPFGSGESASFDLGGESLVAIRRVMLVVVLVERDLAAKLFRA